LAEKISPAAGPCAATKQLPSADKTMALLLFFPRPRHDRGLGPHSHPELLAEQLSRRRSRNGDMQQVVTLFWSAPSRIGRRLAQIVAIAAASLPDVGA
jgi:hypothetical protein